jgi:methylthioribose-1-phosphate isomerase
MVKAIEWKNGKVRMIDQTLLPNELVIIDCENYQAVAEAIKSLRIRGAPAIGIAAAMAVALGAQTIRAADYQDFIAQLEPIYKTLLATRPTAVNIRWAVERLKRFLRQKRDISVSELQALLVAEAQTILEEDIQVNKTIGKYGAKLIKDGDTVITHCNAGSLATGGYGTATAPVRTAIEQGKKVDVIVKETRPVLQGARLTAWELMQDGIPCTLIIDPAAATLIKKGEIDLAIVGADRIANNGDVANKIGTYPLAIFCKIHHVPFYVASPLSSIDFSIDNGELIEIEERPDDEITHIAGKRIAPPDIKVINFAFDVTPAEFITAIITEKGVFKPEEIYRLASEDANNQLNF